MFADELRRAIQSAPTSSLPDVARALWGALAGGQITEGQAETLSAEIDARRVSPAAAPAARRVGSRPRSPASLERRRRWAASGGLPVALATKFTQAEVAALAVIASEVAVRGDCRLPIGAIAGKAGISETSVRNAVREARRLGLLHVEERRLDRWRSETNVLRVVSTEWRAWIARGGRGGGCRSSQPPDQDRSSVRRETTETDPRGFRDGEEGDRRRQNGPPARRMRSGRPAPGSTGR